MLHSKPHDFPKEDSPSFLSRHMHTQLQIVYELKCSMPNVLSKQTHAYIDPKCVHALDEDVSADYLSSAQDTQSQRCTMH
jgi:hypothetical protein